MQYGIIVLEGMSQFDETGFAMGLITTAEVVTRADMHEKALSHQLGNQERFTPGTEEAPMKMW
jgi:hypothetical protein